MANLKGKSLKFKLVILALFGVLPILLGLLLYVFPIFESYLIQQRKDQVRSIVDLTATAIEGLHQQVVDKKITEEEGREEIKSIIHAMRYNTGDYLFVYSMDGKVFAHGLMSDLEGKDRSEAKDADGKPYVKEFHAIAVGPGAGFSSYKFPKVKDGPPLDKISYIRTVPSWGWYVGSGLYFDEVAANIQSIKMKAISACLILAALTLTMSWLFSTKVSGTLVAVSRGLTDGAEEITHLARKFTESSEKLAGSAVSQSEQLQKTSAAVEETSSMTGKNAESSLKSKAIAEKALISAEKGKKAIEDASTAIQEIARNSDEILKRVKEGNNAIAGVVQVINQIGAKTKVIDDIVFQTKLLSFNASVEAARAGEHGKGFGVVAQEIGNLAQKSGVSAKEITELLSVSVKNVENVVRETQNQIEQILARAKDKVSAGVSTSDKCKEILDEIVEHVQEVGKIVSEISSASQEQAHGISEINKAVAEIDSLSHHNNSASQESAQSATRLEEQLVSVRGLISRLDETVQGSLSRSGPHSYAPDSPDSETPSSLKAA